MEEHLLKVKGYQSLGTRGYFSISRSQQMQSLTTCCGSLGGASHFRHGLKNCVLKAPNPGAAWDCVPTSFLWSP